MQLNNPVEQQFVDSLIETKAKVHVFLANGIKLQGVITSRDDRVILLEANKSQIVYNHVISTIIPV